MIKAIRRWLRWRSRSHATNLGHRCFTFIEIGGVQTMTIGLPRNRLTDELACYAIARCWLHGVAGAGVGMHAADPRRWPLVIVPMNGTTMDKLFTEIEAKLNADMPPPDGAIN